MGKERFMKNGVFSLEYDKETLRDMVLELQQENQQLKERIEYLERSNNRREDTIIEQRQEISNLEDNYCNRTDCAFRIKDSKKYDSLKQKYDKQVENWFLIKGWIYKELTQYYNGRNKEIFTIYRDLFNEMKKLEKRGDSNE